LNVVLHNILHALPGAAHRESPALAAPLVQTGGN